MLPVDTSRILYLLFSLCHSVCCRVTSEDSGDTHYISNMFGAKTGFGAGPTKAHNTGDDSLCSTDIVQLQQLIM